MLLATVTFALALSTPAVSTDLSYQARRRVRSRPPSP